MHLHSWVLARVDPHSKPKAGGLRADVDLALLARVLVRKCKQPRRRAIESRAHERVCVGGVRRERRTARRVACQPRAGHKHSAIVNEPVRAAARHERLGQRSGARCGVCSQCRLERRHELRVAGVRHVRARQVTLPLPVLVRLLRGACALCAQGRQQRLRLVSAWKGAQ
eukprot:144412-Chlamydomonas_euryale.AAC.1